MDHVDDYLPDHALGLLEDPTRQSVEGHLLNCARCSTRLAELGGALRPNTPAIVATAAPLTPLRLRLASGPEGRFAPYADRVSKLFDLSVDRARALLELLSDPDLWLPGPAPGVRVFPVSPGPALAGARTLFLEVEPGGKVPYHVHLGDEHVLVLQGGFRDSTGVEGHAGHAVLMPAGSAHAVDALPGEPCLCGVAVAPSA